MELPDDRAQSEEVEDDAASKMAALHDQIDALELDKERLLAGAVSVEAAEMRGETEQHVVEISKLLTLRTEVVDFALVMEEKFRKHDGDGWDFDGPLDGLFARVAEEIREMFEAMKAGKSLEEVLRECADVSNFALLIAFNYDPETTDAEELASMKLSDLMAKLLSPSGDEEHD